MIVPDGNRPQVAGVGISHPERVLFPGIGATKLDLAVTTRRSNDGFCRTSWIGR